MSDKDDVLYDPRWDWSRADSWSIEHSWSSENGEDIGDKRLRRLGIDPDADSLTILLELKKRWAEIQRQKKEANDKK